MSTGPYGTPPPEPPPPSPSAPPPGYWSPPPPSGPYASQSAPDAYRPQALGDGSPAGFSLIIAAVLVVAVLVAGGVGYIVVGNNVAGSRLDDARAAYNAVMGHQAKLKGDIGALSVHFVTVAVTTNATPTSVTQWVDLARQVESQSSSVLDGVDRDDGSLADAANALGADRWLTLRSRSSLDPMSAKIARERVVLAQAITITSDYVLFAAFYETFFTAIGDLEAFDTAAQARDINGANVATQMFKADVAKAIKQEGAPGLPSEMAAMLLAFQSVAKDLSDEIFQASLGNLAGYQADVAAANADQAKLATFDSHKMDLETASYYQPLVAAFNTDLNKAAGG